MRKSFVLYSDMHSFVKAMTNEQAGEFVKLVYAYACDDVIDESDDPLVVATFNHVKLKLDECAEKYEEKRKKARESARKRWENRAEEGNANACERIKPQCDTMLNVTDTVTVTVTDTVKDKEEHMSVSELTDVTDWWNGLAENYNLTKIRMLSKTRKSKLKQRIKSIGSYDFFKETVEDAISNSPFLQGENKQGWKCDFDFILQESSFIKMVEGKYNGQRRLTETEKRIEAFKKLREARA